MKTLDKLYALVDSETSIQDIQKAALLLKEEPKQREAMAQILVKYDDMLACLYEMNRLVLRSNQQRQYQDYTGWRGELEDIVSAVERQTDEVALRLIALNKDVRTYQDEITTIANKARMDMDYLRDLDYSALLHHGDNHVIIDEDFWTSSSASC